MSKRSGRIRPRLVSFGNPALGTYGGCVYTLEGDDSRAAEDLALPTGASAVERVVAMVDVPPEQVPEGILNFCRSHRPFIQLVRIVISSPEPPEAEASSPSPVPPAPESALCMTPAKTAPPPRASDSSSHLTQQLASLKLEHNRPSPKTPLHVPPSPSASAMESAASILAADEMAAETTSRERQELLLQGDDDDGEDESVPPSRTYLVLFELSTVEAANVFVEDLHGKPYTSLEEDVTCSVHHVVGLKGQDGVSLMSPFFAPSPPSSPSMLGHTNSHDNATTSLQKSSHAEETSSKPSPTSSPHVPSSTAEAHNCAVCLERMDLDRTHSTASGDSANNASASATRTTSPILTTVCNHSFHMECLLQWQDSPCPVCRYDHSGLNEALSQCHVCGITEYNYVCLICGVISCGGNRGVSLPSPREHIEEGTDACDTAAGSASEDIVTTDEQQQGLSRMGGHARAHYEESLHAYALDTETQHVWDFVGQGYVHRLLQNAKDDKLVEVNDPHNTSSYERSLSPGLSDAQEGEVVHRKLEGFASQYYTLLKSQLEQQRIFYEGRLEEIRREYGRGGVNDGRKKAASASAELISALKQERNQLTQRCMSLRRRYNKVSEDVAFLRNMNESLEANKAPMKRQVEEAQRERSEARNMIQSCLPALEEKVTMLMLQLEESEDVQNISEQPPPRTGKSWRSGGDRKPAARR